MKNLASTRRGRPARSFLDGRHVGEGFGQKTAAAEQSYGLRVAMAVYDLLIALKKWRVGRRYGLHYIR
jgi:hypothetical protein